MESQEGDAGRGGGVVGVEISLELWEKVSSTDAWTQRYLMFYAQSTVKGCARKKQNAFWTQVKILIHCSIHYSNIEDLENFGEKKKLNGPGKAETK